jgi:hypothetical protein
MKNLGLFLAAATLFASQTQVAQARKSGGSLPSKVAAARTIYVDNQTTEAELQNTAYTELSKWGRLQIVDTPQKADIILRISNGNMVRFVPSDEHGAPTPEAKPVKAEATPAADAAPVAPGFTRISLVEPKSGSVVWSEDRKTNTPQAARHLLDGVREAFDQQEKSR